MSTVDSNTLKWVKSEIDETLKQSQTALEAYVEDTADESQLRFCINYLHQVHGTLQMVELYGAALAIEEMEKLSHAILNDQVSNKDDAFETLMRGIIQVPDYLEHLLAGNQDMPVVLLPLLNDMRAARNEALLSEGALFTPDLSITAPAQDESATEASDTNLSDLAKKLRHKYHLGLLSWFRDKNPKAGLQQIYDVIRELGNAASSDEARRVFWIANGLVESLKDDGVENNAAVKMLLGHVDRQIKKIIDNGEEVLDQEPPEELEKNLLYYVASSTADGEQTSEIKKQFQLKEIMPDNQAIEQARADMSVPNAALMDTVSSVIIEDINKVKDNLDIFVRADDKDMSVLDIINSSLKQMGDTLAMLNLGVQREAVLKQSESIGKIINGTLEPTEKNLMEVAAAMIAVENSLGDTSTTGMHAAASVAGDDGETAVEQLQGAEQHKLMKTVLDEAKVNLGKIKEAISEFSKDNENRDQLVAVPGLLEQIQGGLQILSLSEAANLLGLTKHYVSNSLLKNTVTPDYEDMNHLADAISSLEYYMESLIGDWGQPQAILDVAEQSLQSLGINTEEVAEALPVEDLEVSADVVEDEEQIPAEPESLQTETTVSDVEELSSAEITDDNSLEDPGLEELDLGNDELSLEDVGVISDINDEGISLDSDLSLEDSSLDDISLELAGDDSEPETLSVEGITLDESLLDDETNNLDTGNIPELSSSDAEQPDTEKEADSDQAQEVSLLDDTIDDEIIEIFLEEAEEAYEEMSKLLPGWVADNSDEASLKEIRRAFHTLKGSGRLVGALDVGEFAWAYENMLNRVLDHTVEVTPEMLEVIRRGHSALPELFNLFKEGNKPGQAIQDLMKHADALSEGKSISLDNSSATSEVTDEQEEIVAIDLPDEPDIELVTEENVPIEIDPALLEIYRKEVATHTESLRQYVTDWKDGNKQVNHQLLRALHTLTGSSRTTGVQPLATICSSFEHYVKHLQDNEIPFPEVAVGELEATIELVVTTVDSLDKPGAILPEHSDLLVRIENLPKEVVAEEPAAKDEVLPAPDYDEELLEIFLEEGFEILDESDHTIHEWMSHPEDQELIEALQRQLHTLKGGARMAGVTELGDLGHSIESLLTAVVDGHMKPSRPMLELVQRSQDRLAKMLDQVQNQQGLTPATDLIHEVDMMLQNREVYEAQGLEPLETPEIDEITKDDQVKEQDSSSDELTLDFADDESDKTPELELPDVVEELTELETELKQEASPEEDSNVLSFDTTDSPDIADSDSLSPASDQEDKSTETVPDVATTEHVSEQEPEAESKEPVQAEVQPETETLPAEETDRRKTARVQQGEQIRVRAELLDNLVNFAGEVSIYRSRLEQQTNNFRYNISEFDQTVNRLREQLRQFEIETEAQIEYKNEEALSSAQAEFDPLEMDRFTTMQHLSRAMMESLGDLDSLRGIMNNLTRESETLLLQQSRVNTELQEGLMRTRMVPFSGQAARLRRIVRQTSSELGKHAELSMQGIDTELDRTVLDRIIPPIEHMLRNAVAHGIEKPADRKSKGKAETGSIDLTISREGSEIVFKIKDDGAGINLDAIRKKGIAKGLIKETESVNKDQLLEMIMQSGFSTADSVSQISGRGVGMDVVNTEIKQLGGVFAIDTEEGTGTTFTVNLPLTLAISRALMVTIGEETYAIPLLSVEGVERVSVSQVKEMQKMEKPVYEWVGEDYDYMHLGSMMGINEFNFESESQMLPLLMVRTGDHRAAVLVDNLLGSREIVVKPIGPQLSTLRGISGATIMGDGSVVLIVDLGVLIRLATSSTVVKEDVATEAVVEPVSESKEDLPPLVMVVDDSITVRKVTTRLLERHDMRVVAAKDGVDALTQLQDTIPDIMLLDVEMPRMDGFELATNMRNDEQLKNVPIIMITSRTGQKHRDRAASIGVNIYMGKPYTESDLLDNIHLLTGKD